MIVGDRPIAGEDEAESSEMAVRRRSRISRVGVVHDGVPATGVAMEEEDGRLKRNLVAGVDLQEQDDPTIPNHQRTSSSFRRHFRHHLIPVKIPATALNHSLAPPPPPTTTSASSSSSSFLPLHHPFSPTKTTTLERHVQDPPSVIASRALGASPAHSFIAWSPLESSQVAASSSPGEDDAPRKLRVPAAYHSVIAGAGAGLVSSVVTCPLDVIKTRLQASSRSQDPRTASSIRGTVKEIIAQGGLKGLYRGLGPTIAGYLPNWGIYFSVYDAVKRHMANEGALSETGGGGGGGDHWAVHILAAMTAGATGTILTNPLWVIKTRFMAQAVLDGPNERRYKHTLDAALTIYRQEGLRAFYKGLTPSLIGVSHVAVQFPLYEQLKVWAAPLDGSALSSESILLCSALSKMVASLVTYPHEVLRTRLQIRKRLLAPKPLPPGAPKVAATAEGLVATFREIKKNDGWKGFYRGLSVNLMRTVPNSAVTMLTYELIMRRLTTP